MALTSLSTEVDPAPRDAWQTKTNLLDQLTQGVLELTSSTAWSAWLRTSRQFHRYSFHYPRLGPERHALIS